MLDISIDGTKRRYIGVMIVLALCAAEDLHIACLLVVDGPVVAQATCTARQYPHVLYLGTVVPGPRLEAAIIHRPF